jgi:hypothetical protein
MPPAFAAVQALQIERPLRAMNPTLTDERAGGKRGQVPPKLPEQNPAMIGGTVGIAGRGLPPPSTPLFALFHQIGNEPLSGVLPRR